MDLQAKLIGVLHIALGLAGLVAVGLLYLVFGSISLLAGLDSYLVGFFSAVLAAVSIFVVAMSVAEIAAALSYLRGSEGGRAFMVVLSVLQLLNLPIGTVIGAYSLWVLLHVVRGERAALAAAAASGGSGSNHRQIVPA
jgi:hypothetical protein